MVRKRWTQSLHLSVLKSQIHKEVIEQNRSISKTHQKCGAPDDSIITNLIRAKYQEGEDVAAHIARLPPRPHTDSSETSMTLFLLLSSVFSCLRAGIIYSLDYRPIIHQPKWSARSNMSLEHARIKWQEVATAYQAQYAPKGKENKGSQPFCNNCRKPGHTIEKCFHDEGQGPTQKKENKAKNDGCENWKKKNLKRANQTVAASSVASPEKSTSETEDNCQQLDVHGLTR